MITNRAHVYQLPDVFNSAFTDLKIGRHLRQAGIHKVAGYSCLLLFQTVFLLVFQHKNWYRLLEGRERDSLPGKDAVYRFLNCPTFSWRKFLLSLSGMMVQRTKSLTSHKRVTVFIVDDSTYDRSRSKAVELLARVHDHTTGRFIKGFRTLTLGWSDGHTFLPIDFSMLSSAKPENRYNEINSKIDKRTLGYKRRIESIQTTPSAVFGLLENAIKAGIHAQYVLMDSWFTHAPLLQLLHNHGLSVIGMVKALKQRYQVGHEQLSLQQLYQRAKPNLSHKQILCSILVRLECGVAAKIVFVKHRHKKREWLAVLSTDTTLSDDEIVRIYSMRWDIEPFFKTCKHVLKLEKEFQGRSYDQLIAHTTIVFTRYIFLSWQARQSSDNRALGGMFYDYCDEVNERDWADALRQIWSFVEPLLQSLQSIDVQVLKSQLLQWISGLPNYIKGYLPVASCES